MKLARAALRFVFPAALAVFIVSGCISYDPPPAAAKKPTPAQAALNRAHERKPAFVSVDGHKVFYVSTGVGPRTIVFVHGWAANGNFWNEQVPALEDGARLVFVDLPGHGKSDKPQVNYTIDYLAEAVLGVVQATGAERVTLVGHSLGVAVICKVYALAPEKVAALVAVEGSLRLRQISLAAAEHIVAPYRAVNYREQMKDSVVSMFPMPGTEGLRQKVFDQMMLTPEHVLASTLSNSLAVEQATWEPKRIEVPLVVLNAKTGGWTQDYRAYALSLSPQAEYRTFERVGHFLMLERPAEFNAALTELLAKHDLMAKVESASQ
jgi:pimeloyl-ACP methyl ester carboxylesterase